MTVWLLTMTFASSFVPSPRRAFAPTRQNGPISTPRPSRASGCTTASGWIKTDACVATGSPLSCRISSHVQNRRVVPEQPLIRNDREKKFALADGLIIDPRRRVQAADVHPDPHDVGFHFKLVARHDRPPELEFIHASEVGYGGRQDVRLKNRRPPKLRHRFNDKNARHDRVVREVSSEEPLVERNVLVADCALLRNELGNPINEQERVTMRKDVHDGADVNVCHLIVSGICAMQTHPATFRNSSHGPAPGPPLASAGRG